ncbi:hypothetical protein PInf_015541 [Phytophthora infestans]|nr:hypothetical protein PInf_015541 [Phytophthora infestans]
MASANNFKSNRMTYRFLGNSGLLVSKLSLGSWMDVSDKYTPETWYEMMKLAFENGINFFDNAELYGEGLAEKNMGAAIKKGIAEGTWSREDLVITTKIFWGAKDFMAKRGPNEMGLSRKHIVEGTKASLKRLELEYVDVIFCHRPDRYTPIEETVRAMNFVINQGWAFYWGTSQWSAAEIIEACEIADRLGLVRPIVEQTIYSILDRNKVEFGYVDLYKKYKLGLTTWSPLAYGILTGKHSSGPTEGSRMDTLLFKWATPDFAERVAKADVVGGGLKAQPRPQYTVESDEQAWPTSMWLQSATSVPGQDDDIDKEYFDDTRDFNNDAKSIG